MVLPVWILTLCSLDVNWSLTVNTWPFSISFDLGSLVRTRCVGFPQARDCSARTSSLSGISVSCWISWEREWIQKVNLHHIALTTIYIQNKQDRFGHPDTKHKYCTSNVDFSLLLKSMRIVIWNVETCRMCFLALQPVTWAPPTISDPSSCKEKKPGWG